MRSKLAFPSGGMETKYVWDRHSIQNNGIYKWDKHNVINKTEYYWNKYSILNEKTEFQWSRYEIVEHIEGENKYYTKGDYIDTITSSEDGIYPEDGIYEGYWYETLKSYIWNQYEIITDPVYRWDVYKTRNKEYFTAEKYQLGTLSVASNNNWGEAISGNQTSNVNGWQIHLWDIPADEKITIYGLNKGITKPSPVDEIEMTLTEFAQIGNTGGAAPGGMGSYCNIMGVSLLGKTYIIYNHGVNFFMPCSINNADNTCNLGICCDYGGLWQYNIDKGLSNSNGDTVVYKLDEHETPNRTYTNVADVLGIYGEPEQIEIVEGEAYFENAKTSELRNYPFKAIYNNPYGTEEYYFIKIKTLNSMDDEFMPDTNIDPIQVISLSKDTYPEDGYQDGKWYKYLGYYTEASPGKYLGQVIDTNIYAYPDNGVYGTSWYIYHSSIKDQGHYVWDRYKLKYTYKWSRQPVIYKEVIDYYDYYEMDGLFYTNEQIDKTNYKLKEGMPTNWRNLSDDTEIILYGFAPEKGHCFPDNDGITPKRLVFTAKELYEQYFKNIEDTALDQKDKVGYIPVYYTWLMGFSVKDKTYYWYQSEDSNLSQQATQYYFKVSKNDDSYNIEMTYYENSSSTYSGVWELSVYDAFNKGRFYSNSSSDYYGYLYSYNYFIDVPYGSLISDNASPNGSVDSFNSPNNVGKFNELKISYLINFPFRGYRYISDTDYYSGNVKYPINMYLDKDTYKIDTTAPIEYVYDTDINKYSGHQDGYYYKRLTNETITSNGEFIDKVYSTTASLYPLDGKSNGYWYIYTGVEPIAPVKKDAYLGQVVSTDKNYYPADNYRGSYWYVYTGSQLFQYKGSFIKTVDSEDRYTYPTNGVKGGYWYVYEGFENNGPYKSRWIDEVETNKIDTYPKDGISGNYWYVYKKSYEGYKLQITDAKIKGGIDYNLDVNPEEDYIVGTVASAEIAFEYNNVNRDIQQYIDANECIYYTWQPADNDWRQIGIFYLEDVTEVRDTIKVKAYDSIIKTETYIDELIENINDWPLNINQMFNKTCEYLGLNGIVSEEINNSNNFITDNFEAINITGRQLLQYIAEAAGGLIMANADGALYLTKYLSKNIPLDKSKYVRYVKHNYSTQPIEGVNVRVTSDDMGITAGADSGNVYIIENNPLFFDTTGSGTIAAVNNLYYKLKDVSYVPAEVELLQDFGINCGDIITVDKDTFYVMSKNLSPSGCKLKCVGNKHRQLKESGLNSDIIALRGKTNELYRDLEQTRSTLTDIGADLRTEISQTAEEIKLYASNLNNSLNSSVSIKLDSITSEVNNLDKELSSRIEQTESSISSTVTEQGRVITEIKQDLDGIDLVYNSENGTASITIGDITVTDLVNGEYVTRTVAGIDLTGYVTFHSLETAGATTINGSNITTGTINADRINMRGAISWSDLSSDVQDAIDAGVSGDVDIPDYIKSTYIDGARIESPTINGGTLNSVAAYGDATHTTTIEDSQISFNIKEYGSSGGSFGYTAGVIDAYVNDTGKPDSARTGLKIESYSDGSSYSGGLSLVANRGLVLQSKNQDIFFYLPGRNPVALSTILDKLGL